MKKEFDFAKEFGEIDEKLVEHAGKNWNKKTSTIVQLYSKKIAGIAVLAVCCIAVLGNSKAQAAIKQFTTKIGEAFEFDKDLSSYTELINQTQTKNGISLTLKEVIIDDRVLMVSVHMDDKQNKEMPNVWLNEEKTLINGQKHMVYETVSSEVPDTDAKEPKNDNVLVQIYEDQILPEGEINVHLVLNAAPKFSLSDNIEEFVYDFTTTAEELKAKTVKQDLNITVGTSDAKQKHLTLKDLTMNDLYCRITAEGTTWNDDWPNEYDLKLKGTDSLGNPVSLEGGTFLSENEMLFTTNLLGDYEAGEVIEADEFQMSVPDKNCDYLDLQLYERKIIWDDTTEIAEDEEVYTQESDDEQKTYSKEENYGWEPVGKPFRITITRTGGMTDDKN